MSIGTKQAPAGSGRARTVNGSIAGGAAINADHHAHGLLAWTPISLLALVGVSGIAFVGASIFQITGTEQAVFGFLQSKTQVDPALVGRQVSEFFAGKLSYDNGITFVCGFVSQLALLFVAFPPHVLFFILHRRHNPAGNTSLAEEASKIHRLQEGTKWTIVAFNVVTDFLYATRGHHLFNMVFGFIPWPQLNESTSGIFIVGLFYPLCLCFACIYTSKAFVAALEVLLLKFRRQA